MIEQMNFDTVELDRVKTIAAAEAGMAQSEVNREFLKTFLDQAIEQTAKCHQQFTTDAVWGLLGAIPSHKGMSSAIGPALKRAAKNGLIESTGQFALCERPISHGNPLRVWRSLVFH